MHALPIAALAAVVGTYAVATDRLAGRFALDYASEGASHQPHPFENLAIHDLMERAAPGLDAARCDKLDALAAVMADELAAEPVDERIVSDGLQMVLWGSTELNAWAIVHNGDDGIACVVSTGMGWNGQSTADQIFDGALVAS